MSAQGANFKHSLREIGTLRVRWAQRRPATPAASNRAVPETHLDARSIAPRRSGLEAETVLRLETVSGDLPTEDAGP